MNNNRFYFNEDDIEHKCYVNLSEECQLVISEDRNTFSTNESPIPEAGFLNTIISNYYKESLATISERVNEKIDELESLYSSKDFKSYDRKTIGAFIDKYVKKYELELIDKSTSYPSGDGIRFRLNNENFDTLVDSEEGGYYNGYASRYLKALFEEYSRLPRFKREQIYFHDNFNTITEAISLEKKVKITLVAKTNVKGNKQYSRKFFITPYKIVQDKTNMYNYILCLAEEINSDGTLSNKNISSFRLSFINKAEIYLSKGSHISKEKGQEIEAELKKRTIQFMAGDTSLIKVRFTNKGLDNYQRQLYMRPCVYKKEDSNTYIFECTEQQASNYFFKFGWDAEIIEPESLRNNFIKRYESALRTYKGETKDEIIDSSDISSRKETCENHL